MTTSVLSGEQARSVNGAFVTLEDGEQYYRISHVDQMPPFLTALASDSNIWMYLSSAGPVACGRVNANGSLFPYETDDKLHKSGHSSGPKTVFRVKTDAGDQLWEPFAPGYNTGEGLIRNIYKRTQGNALIYEEIHTQLKLTFRTCWQSAAQFGIIRTSRIISHGERDIQIDLLDGFQNILPSGISKSIQDSSSCLGDAYKRSEMFTETGLGIYYLTTEIIDRPEVREVLYANVVYSCGPEHAVRLVSEGQIRAFYEGRALTDETESQGVRGAYFVTASLSLSAGGKSSWRLVADTGLSQSQVAALDQRLREAVDRDKGLSELSEEIDRDILNSNRNLRRIIAENDGLQLTEDTMADVHHMANVLYNTMRGGYFIDGYLVKSAEFIRYIRTRNQPLWKRMEEELAALPETVTIEGLKQLAEASGDADLIRAEMEFLPLSFARRHGDPSRPWNAFQISFPGLDAPSTYAYEGNWRDIFQNWEAMSFSYPEFIEHMIAKFVNASTADGFNPYRITHEGIDWEVLEPHNPWSSIGYWGDHQIVYLLKLLETSAAHHPEQLKGMLTQASFCYADVPYHIRPYKDILRDVRNTITFSESRAGAAAARVSRTGTDGKLLTVKDRIWYVCLTEKLLVPLLAKLSNLVMDGGIWMNTLRPEWNDANNAIVGYGLSMVTVHYLHRYMVFLAQLLENMEAETVNISSEVADWFVKLETAYGEAEAITDGSEVTDSTRRQLLDACGEAFSSYRETLYAVGFTGKTVVSLQRLRAFVQLTLRFIRHTMAAGRTPEGLWHAYNLLEADPEGTTASVRHLYDMFEGQVAAVSSGGLKPEAALITMEALENSGMYRQDLKACTLYPVRTLPRFLEKNSIPDTVVARSPLLMQHLSSGNTRLVHRDAMGAVRFHARFRNAADLRHELASGPEGITGEDAAQVLEIYESVFHHRAFTGRSGVMFRYEGIGCVYWHMNSKYLLAVQENYRLARATEADQPVTEALKHQYFKVRDGLGFRQEAAVWGAFPFDPYSHTPASAGAQQPGMTGQVKEEILTRRGELGVEIHDGQIRFRPELLRKEEFLTGNAVFDYPDTDGNWLSIPLEAGSLAFTMCQVPVVYQLKESPGITVIWSDGSQLCTGGNGLDTQTSREIFRRKGRVKQIRVGICPSF